MRAKKSLGQNFLKSERALRAIVEAGQVDDRDIILEIGPGTGALTQKLLDTEAKVIAVEKDGELFETLKQKYEKEISSKQLILIHDDIINLEPRSYKLEPRSYKLIANIPYNITGAILKKFLETDTQPERMVLLVQKEVAERIIGTPRHGVSGGGGGKIKESILSISIKVYGSPKYVETVKAGSFVPRPKVDSAIITIKNISKAFFIDMISQKDTPDTECLGMAEGEFFRMVRAGFKAKRKKLSSNLAIVFEKDKVEKAFQKLGLDPNTRAEDVNIENWRKLASSLINN